MKLIQSVLISRLTKQRKTTLSLVLDNGEIYHFFSLADGVAWSHTDRYLGRYAEAVRREMGRKKACVVAESEHDDVLSSSKT